MPSIVVVSFALTVCTASAQTTPAQIADSARHEIDAANASGDGQRLAQITGYLQRAAIAHPTDGWIAHYLGFAYYRSVTFARARRDAKETKALLNLANATLEKAAALMPLAETHALRSAVLGQIIAESGSPITGMRLGSKADKELDVALKLAPANPRVWAVRASAVLYKPKLFGGSITKAEEYARKAIELAASDHPAGVAPRWGEGDAYLFLGQALAAQKKYDEAKAAYQRVLALEPGNGYVTNVLMPALNQQMGR